MYKMKEQIIYEDEDLIVAEKPAGLVVYSENEKQPSLIKNLISQFSYLNNVGQSPRLGIIHRLDKDTSGILLIAKNNKALEFFQKEFQIRKVVKKYIVLVEGEIIENQGIIETLIGRSKKDGKKQKVYLPCDPNSKGKRKAITEYRVLERFNKKYTLVEAHIKTGRKHQIRVHFASILHPVVGDKLYGFKNQLIPKDLKRQFLHASYLKIELLNGETKEFISELPEDLEDALKGISK